MASRQGFRSKKSVSKLHRAVNSPSSSTTSSSKQLPETSFEAQSSPASSSARSKPQYFYSETVPLDEERSIENVTVTVRFRPLSPREIRQGEEIAWYADGETIVRNEHNASIAYAYDRVFGPTTTTRHVYDVAAQHIVSGSMEGINGTIFAYGVTSSGKTHTMHGDQRSPGIIPLAVKDAFSIIQETPNREFLLRVSYLEIYNEVVNDLLNPAGQNLRIREDLQGTFVDGIKEEVVLSPAHALSLIAAGEEHRHVGSTNFNLLSSRSHTIFTLTIESTPCGENSEGEAVNLSQLNLIDLAGSESARAETTGIRRKEGSYINKSLLTLGTVISKLTDGRATHIPYRDSKLTRLLQSSLSGRGRVSLICTVTPASSNSEETHNTMKFAHRAKHIEIQASQNKIIDEKSLIKKYQSEIRNLKEELEQLKRGIGTVPRPKDVAEDDIVLLKQKVGCNLSFFIHVQRIMLLHLVQVKTADNRIIQEQLNEKIRDCEELQETVAVLKQQLSEALQLTNSSPAVPLSQQHTKGRSIQGKFCASKDNLDLRDANEDLLLQEQATKIEELKQKVTELTEAKDQLEVRNQKLAEESSYAKGLASAAAVELKALSEEVAKLLNHNERLAAELAVQQNSPSQRRGSGSGRNNKRDGLSRRHDQGGFAADVKRELAMNRERELSYEAALMEKDQKEAELQKKVEESKQREAYLENELANMWVLVAKLKKSHGVDKDDRVL
ncbi:kinesin-like protein KIN-7L, chloroplastic [Macadamia integrifolia]|uniref:kinesin-like protein KIN-7L, chloroplastic n=1 Tax=Macadamia integrifolia TaxID=60698 RepID=UPI001C52B02F|nr:kinesin-like protein KIN-7L, chloroplastic [Macadamia integrifolia]